MECLGCECTGVGTVRALRGGARSLLGGKRSGVPVPLVAQCVMRAPVDGSKGARLSEARQRPSERSRAGQIGCVGGTEGQ